MFVSEAQGCQFCYLKCCIECGEVLLMQQLGVDICDLRFAVGNTTVNVESKRTYQARRAISYADAPECVLKGNSDRVII